MEKYEKRYRELRKKYTDEEIADSMLIPADLTEEERKSADEELLAFRMKLLRGKNEEFIRIYYDSDIKLKITLSQTNFPQI